MATHCEIVLLHGSLEKNDLFCYRNSPLPCLPSLSLASPPSPLPPLPLLSLPFPLSYSSPLLLPHSSVSV